MRLFSFLAAALLLAGCAKYAGPTTASGVVVDKQVVPKAYVEVGSIDGG